jgi:hypothetical protein
VGEWSNDRPHGDGTFTLASGIKHSGTWVEGRLPELDAFVHPAPATSSDTFTADKRDVPFPAREFVVSPATTSHAISHLFRLPDTDQPEPLVPLRSLSGSALPRPSSRNGLPRTRTLSAKQRTDTLLSMEATAARDRLPSLVSRPHTGFSRQHERYPRPATAYT